MTGCRCAQHYGLAEYMAELTGKDYGLPAAPGHSPTLAVVSDEPACDDSMTCPCRKHSAERAERIANRRPAPRQPWEAKAA